MTAATMPQDALEAAFTLLDSAECGCACKHDLLSLLREDAPVYRGKGAIEVERLRGFIMTRAANAGLGDALTAYILEELETGTNPYAVAAAARAARSVAALPGEIADLLASAAERIRHVDEFVDFDSYPAPPDARGVTAVAEIIATLASLRPPARGQLEELASRSRFLSPSARSVLEAAARQAPARACCAGRAALTPPEPQPAAGSISALCDIGLENQDGIRARLGDVFAGRPCVVAFFYTRCMNPEKCSRTVGNLAQLDGLLRQRTAARTALVAGITYDPEYDTAQRLARYGADRGMRFGPQCQLFRTTGPFASVRDALALGVGYGSSTVNRHRLELILINPAGQVVKTYVRRLWEPQEIADALEAIPNKADYADAT